MQERLLQAAAGPATGLRRELPLRPANFVSGLEQMPVKFTPDASRSSIYATVRAQSRRHAAVYRLSPRALAARLCRSHARVGVLVRRTPRCLSRAGIRVRRHDDGMCRGTPVRDGSPIASPQQRSAMSSPMFKSCLTGRRRGRPDDSTPARPVRVCPGPSRRAASRRERQHGPRSIAAIDVVDGSRCPCRAIRGHGGARKSSATVASATAMASAFGSRRRAMPDRPRRPAAPRSRRICALTGLAAAPARVGD